MVTLTSIPLKVILKCQFKQYLGKHSRLYFFFSFFLWQKFYIVFHSSYASICKDLQKTIVLSSGPFCKYLHLQYNVFLIYDEAKAVPQRPSHNKVPQKHAANRQGNTSHKSMIPTKLLLCIFVEITLRHWFPHPL